MKILRGCFLFLGAIGLGIVAHAANPADTAKAIQTYTTYPVKVTTLENGNQLFDFGDVAVGWPEFQVEASGEMKFYVSEVLKNDGSTAHNIAHKWNSPYVADKDSKYYGASAKGIAITTDVTKGATYKADFSPLVKAGRWTLTTPSSYPVCIPFRYVEVEQSPYRVTTTNLKRVDLRYPFNMNEESFACSDKNLMRVHDFCKRSIWIDSYLGYWVDGDRERCPYPGDMMTTMMSAAAISSDYAIGRKTFKWVNTDLKLTWPREWAQAYIWCGREDWQMTGDTSAISAMWNFMTGTALPKISRDVKFDSDGLINCTGETSLSNPRTLVDWPAIYRYDYDYNDGSATADKCNAILNAQYYRTLRELGEMAQALGKTDSYSSKLSSFSNAFNKAFFDSSCGLYRDERTSKKYSVQANAAALAAGLVPSDKVATVANHIVKCGMKCSIYFSQFVLDALFEAGRADAAIQLMTATGGNSWIRQMDYYDMTTVCECWDFNDSSLVPMPDSTHAWGTSPLNVISRKLLGVTPAKPGWSQAKIEPQFGNLLWAKGVVPTPKGGINVSYTNGNLTVKIPTGMTATVKFGNKTMSLASGGSCTINQTGSSCAHARTQVTGKNVEANCTTKGSTSGLKCLDCGQVIIEETTIPALGHTWGSWTVITQATTSKPGSQKHTCSRCTVTETVVIPILSPISWSAQTGVGQSFTPSTVNMAQDERMSYEVTGNSLGEKYVKNSKLVYWGDNNYYYLNYGTFNYNFYYPLKGYDAIFDAKGGVVSRSYGYSGHLNPDGFKNPPTDKTFAYAPVPCTAFAENSVLTMNFGEAIRMDKVRIYKWWIDAGGNNFNVQSVEILKRGASAWTEIIGETGNRTTSAGLYTKVELSNTLGAAIAEDVVGLRLKFGYTISAHNGLQMVSEIEVDGAATGVSSGKQNANSWKVSPSIAASFTEGTRPTTSLGTPAYGTASANYSADELAALEPGDYTYIVRVKTGSNYAALVKKIPFTVLHKEVSAAQATGDYRLASGSGDWNNATTWSGVYNGTWPHFATDSAYVTNTTKKNIVLDLKQNTYALKTFSNNAQYGMTLKNGGLTLGENIAVGPGSTTTFAGMTVTGASASKFTMSGPGAEIAFTGANTLANVALPISQKLMKISFADGTTSLGAISGSGSDAVDFQISNAHVVASSLKAGTMPFKFNLTIGSNFAPGGEAMIKTTGECSLSSGSTLVMDVTEAASGTYTLISAGSLSGTDALTLSANITAAENTSTALSKNGNDLVLTVTKVEAEEGAIEPMSNPNVGYLMTGLGADGTEATAVYTNTTMGGISWTAPDNVSEIQLLVVGGGGAGGAQTNTAAGGAPCGGGGGGAVYYHASYSVTPAKSYAITVGRGGAAIWCKRGENGGDSVFGSIVAVGGGAGGAGNGSFGRNGGSGGGGAFNSAWTKNYGTNTLYTLPDYDVHWFGHDGGTGVGSPGYSAGGGGGAGTAGYSGNEKSGGEGGQGKLFALNGIPTYFAAGGGGGSPVVEGATAYGGNGVGGNGGSYQQPGTDAVDGTGSGGGGVGKANGSAGKGGDGVVMIRYVVSGTGGHKHEWTPWVTNGASCTSAGTRTRSCTAADCPIKKQTENVAALGHDWLDWEVTKPATETETGIKTRHCSRCTATETETIPVMGGRLPSGYTELEYLTSSGDAYVDSGVKVATGMTFELDFSANANGSGNTHLWSAYANQAEAYVVGVTSESKLLVGFGYNSRYTGQATTTRQTVKVAYDTGSYTVMQGTVLSGAKSFAGTPTSDTLYFFARHYNGTGDNNGKGTIYAAKIYEKGAVSHEFVPCCYQENTLGFYDLNTSVFHPAVGTLTAGPAKDTPPAHEHVFGVWTTNAAPTCVQAGERSRVCACGEKETEIIVALGHNYQWVTTLEPTATTAGEKQNKCTRCGNVKETSVIPATGGGDTPTGRLPEGFTEVEYVDTGDAGGVYIDTGIVGQYQVWVSAKVWFNESKLTDSYQWLIGSTADTSANKRCDPFYIKGTQVSMTAQYTYNGPDKVVETGKEYTIESYTGEKGDYDSVYMKLNGQKQTLTRKVETAAEIPAEGNGKNMYVGVRHEGSTGRLVHSFCGRIYYLQIKVGGKLVRDYVPCVSNKVAGLYDLVEGKFYPSLKNPFTAGPEKEIPTPPAHEHAFGDWTTNAAPTCVKAGERSRVCACGEKETETLAALEHNYQWVTTLEPTATTAGEKQNKCARCGDVKETAVIPATGGDTPTGRNLPAPFVEVEYVDTGDEGGAYIDTGVEGQYKLWLSAKFSVHTTNARCWLIGSTANPQEQQACDPFYTSYGQIFVGASYTFTGPKNKVVADKAYTVETYTGEKDKPDLVYLKFNNEQVDLSYSTNSSVTALAAEGNGMTLYLGARQAGKNRAINLFKGRIYAVQIKEAGKLARDYVPCVSNNVAGLYDLIQQKFCPSMGAKPFVAGPAVEPTPSTKNPIINGNPISVESVFEKASSQAPITYPSKPELNGKAGENQTILFDKKTVAVPTWFTATLSGNVINLEFTGKGAEPVIADEGTTPALDLSDGKVKLHITNEQPLLWYILESSSNLFDWSPELMRQGSSEFEVNQDGGSSRFYRVRVQDYKPTMP